MFIATARRLKTLAIACLCLIPAPSVAAEPSDRIAAAVDRAFRPLLETYDVPGIAVAVTLDGRAYFFDYGLASKETKAPVTKDTLFEIGSLSKTFNVTLACDAALSGAIALDAHPSTYMPALRDSAIDKASLLELATYTAGGLPLQSPDALKSQAELTDYLRHWTPSAPPGTQRLYSNVSIGLLGHLTALAMHDRYADLVATKVFAPLGLAHTFIDVPPGQMPNYAWGYKAGKPTRVTPGVLDAQAYGVKSTAADMIRFVEDNIAPESVAPALRHAIEGTHVGYFDMGPMVQGLGWEQYPYPVPLQRLLAGNSSEMAMKLHATKRLTPPRTPSQPIFFNKTGSTSGFGAYVAFVPAKRIGIVMLANTNFPISARVTAAHAVLEALAADTH